MPYPTSVFGITGADPDAMGAVVDDEVAVGRVDAGAGNPQRHGLGLILPRQAVDVLDAGDRRRERLREQSRRKHQPQGQESGPKHVSTWVEASTS